MSYDGTCTVEQQALFNSTHGTSIVCLTREDSIGLTLVAESGFISLVAVLGVFILIIVSVDRIVQFFRLIVLLLNSAMLSEAESWFGIRQIYIW
jgi:uncharacterized membrane protein